MALPGGPRQRAGMDTHRSGRRFEELAARHLLEHGWEILGRNVREGRREIDLVIRRNSTVAFVEVKGRRGEGAGDPLEAITPRKQREIATVARAWIRAHGSAGEEYRFDAVAVRSHARGRIEIDHVENAWWMTWSA